MRDAAFKSSAFRNATLKSESYRSAALLCLLAALSIFVIVRGLAVQLHLLVAVQVLILAVVIVHEVVMRRAIKRALREDRDIAEAYSLGCNSYIVKPVEFNKFMDVAAQVEVYWCALNVAPVP